MEPAFKFKEEVVEVSGKGESAEVDPLDEVWMRKTIRRHVQEFGMVLGIVLIGLAGFGAFRNWTFPTLCSLITTGALLAALGYFIPASLHRVWRSWMKLADVLSVVVTTFILTIIWTLLFIPIGFTLKLFAKRVMNTAFREPLDSYWEKRDPGKEDFKLLERQF